MAKTKRLYREKMCYDNRQLVVRKYTACDSNSKPRAARSAPTSQAVKDNNIRRRNDNLGMIMNYNFAPGDYLVVFSVDDNNYEDFASSPKQYLNRLVLRLKRHTGKSGHILKGVFVFGVGGDNQRLHIHALLSSKGLNADWLIGGSWPYGQVFVTGAQLKDGTFCALANYFMENADSCADIIGGHAYHPTGQSKPETHTRDITTEEMFCHNNYVGFHRANYGNYYGDTPYGTPYSRQTFMKNSDKTDNVAAALWEGLKAGRFDGAVDGYNTYIAGNENSDAAAGLETRHELGQELLGAPKEDGLVQAFSDGYALGYGEGFKSGQRKAFEKIAEAELQVFGGSLLYFRGNKCSFVLAENINYIYQHNKLYAKTDAGLYVIGTGELYSFRSAPIHKLPDGTYYTYCNCSYRRRE